MNALCGSKSAHHIASHCDVLFILMKIQDISTFRPLKGQNWDFDVFENDKSSMLGQTIKIYICSCNSNNKMKYHHININVKSGSSRHYGIENKKLFISKVKKLAMREVQRVVFQPMEMCEKTAAPNFKTQSFVIYTKLF